VTSKQAAAAERLRKALNSCHQAGLKGGVFDSSMWVWPVDASPDPYESGNQFFIVIEGCGTVVRSPMNLDGGAGI
jgi:hypothetical protein